MVVPHFRGTAFRIVPARAEWLAGYAGAEVCSGVRGDVRQIRWHVVPGPHFYVQGTAVVGYADGLDIYLSESAAQTVWVARHEALHTLGFQHSDSVVMTDRCHAQYPNVRDAL